jgi:hypothetical protein
MERKSKRRRNGANEINNTSRHKHTNESAGEDTRAKKADACSFPHGYAHSLAWFGKEKLLLLPFFHIADDADDDAVCVVEVSGFALFRRFVSPSLIPEKKKKSKKDL